MNFYESLSLSQVHHPAFEGGVALAQHGEKSWNGIGSSLLHRPLRILFGFQRPIIIFKPTAQRLPLITRFALAQDWPRNESQTAHK